MCQTLATLGILQQPTAVLVIDIADSLSRSHDTIISDDKQAVRINRAQVGMAVTAIVGGGEATQVE